jgi:O-succinylbenzoate synthase
MLQRVELIRVCMPLVHAFRTATSTTTAKDALLVRVETDDGTGWGECVAQIAPSYLPDTIATSRLALRDHLLPRAFAGAPIDDVVGNAPARFALDCALLDARLRAEGISLATHLGATRPYVDAGVAIGTSRSETQLREVVAHFVAAGYQRLKCKIAPGNDAAALRAARAEAGGLVDIAADANASYTLADAETLRALDDLELQFIEQPLAPDALLAHATLALQLGTRICLDESITSATVAHDAIALGAAAVVCIKPGRLGSFAEARAAHDECVATGTPAVAGGMLETGIGRAALLAVAALPGFTVTGDIAASDRYFGPDGDLTAPFVLDAGQLRVPDGPGLGVEVRPEQLARYTIAREVVTRRDV